MPINRRTLSRISGALLPQTPIYWTIDGAYLNATGYSWAMECKPATGGTTLWTKSSGITGQAGSASTPSLLIDWLAADLGATTASGVYVCELTGTSGGKALKAQFQLVVGDEV